MRKRGEDVFIVRSENEAVYEGEATDNFTVNTAKIARSSNINHFRVLTLQTALST
jgi:hypothetical protein